MQLRLEDTVIVLEHMLPLHFGACGVDDVLFSVL